MHKVRYIKGVLRKSDYLRALLTDTSPYELPVIISNDGFYRNLRSIDRVSPTLREFINAFVIESNVHYTIPLRFNISKDKDSRRKLSLLHPSSQYKCAVFYDKYDTLICYYCSEGLSSIRRPSRVGSTFFFKTGIEDNNVYKNNKIDTLDIDRLVRNPASFFAYAGVDRLHKFFDSSEFIRLERKYGYMRLTDITKCFSSIYTHSVSWAIKGSEHSKENRNSMSFGGEFDKLMQKMNYDETNGICIGPEISRVFAEIILTSIDSDVVSRAKEKGLIYGVDFEYRRYVDDFILFSHSREAASDVTSIIEDCLSAYNLHISEGKTFDYERPFLTPKSHIIDNAKKRLGAFFESIIENDPSGLAIPKRLFRPDAIVRSLITSIKSGCYEEGVGYDLVANYVISSLEKRVAVLTRGFDEAILLDINHRRNYAPLLMILLEGMFFFFNVSPTVASSFNVARAMIVTWRFLSDKLPEELLSASGKLHRWVSQLLGHSELLKNLNKQEKIPIEILNVVLASSAIEGIDSFEEHTLRDIVLSGGGENYFSLVSCLFYIKRKSVYSSLLSDIERSILNSLKGCIGIRKSSHDAHLAIDSICCPYLSLPTRIKILTDFRKALGLPPRTYVELETDVAEMEGLPWFVQWEKLDILRLVTKKELSAVY